MEASSGGVLGVGASVAGIGGASSGHGAGGRAIAFFRGKGGAGEQCCSPGHRLAPPRVSRTARPHVSRTIQAPRYRMRRALQGLLVESARDPQPFALLILTESRVRVRTEPPIQRARRK